ncbi:MAG: lysophospholipid acyltransferase family protein [bacterium]
MIHFGYLAARAVVAALPLGWACWIAERVGDVWFGASRTLRTTLDGNLRLLTALSADAVGRRRTARRLTRNFARVVVEFLYLPRMGPDELGRLVDLAGLDRIRRYTDRRPAVLVTGHLGNWELGAAAAARGGVDLHVVVFDHPDPRVASLFRTRREAAGLKVMSVKSAARNLEQVLETSSVGLAGDRDFTGHGVPAAFLGTSAAVPSAYAGLAAARGVPVVPAFCVKGSDGRYHLEVGEALGTGRTGQAGAAEIVAAYLAALEKLVEKYPDQWYRFDKVGR